MLLNPKELNKILRNWRISIPQKLKQELLDEYGNLPTEDNPEYTEQDIYEQLRKRLQPYENINKEVSNLN